jgi:Transglutaminase-like superfamily
LTPAKGASSYFLTLLSALWMPKEFDLALLAGKLLANFIIVQIAKYLQNARSRRWPTRRRVSTFVHSMLSACLLLAALCLSQRVMAGVTLDELRAEPNLTPERFIKHFADFKFALGRDVQKPEAFLKNQSGDCDDFATLAADVLRERGYTTRLVAIFMPHDVHVVCYVKETNSYLDYNCRKQISPLVKCDQELTAIAASVAASFRTQWRSASEYTFQDGVRKFVNTEFR